MVNRWTICTFWRNGETQCEQDVTQWQPFRRQRPHLLKMLLLVVMMMQHSYNSNTTLWHGTGLCSRSLTDGEISKSNGKGSNKADGSASRKKSRWDYWFGRWSRQNKEKETEGKCGGGENGFSLEDIGNNPVKFGLYMDSVDYVFSPRVEMDGIDIRTKKDGILSEFIAWRSGAEQFDALVDAELEQYEERSKRAKAIVVGTTDGRGADGKKKMYRNGRRAK